jgi:hypothetical protein
MSIAEAVVSKRELLFELMMATADRSLDTPEAAVKQFVWGFINVLEASARGDHEPRDIYLASVIPALRDGHMPLETIVSAMVRVTAASTAALGPEHLRWVADYCGDYMARLISIWNAEP